MDDMDDHSRINRLSGETSKSRSESVAVDHLGSHSSNPTIPQSHSDLKFPQFPPHPLAQVALKHHASHQKKGSHDTNSARLLHCQRRRDFSSLPQKSWSRSSWSPNFRGKMFKNFMENHGKSPRKSWNISQKIMANLPELCPPDSWSPGGKVIVA